MAKYIAELVVSHCLTAACFSLFRTPWKKMEVDSKQ